MSAGKLAIWCLVLGGAAVASVWYLESLRDKDYGYAIGYAVGNVKEDKADLEIVVSIQMVKENGLRSIVLSDGSPSIQTWDEWIAEHFKIEDSAGETVTLHREGWAKMIKDRQARNPEFFLSGKLDVGETYHMIFTPYFGQPLQYDHTITVTKDGIPFERVFFQPV